MNFDVDYAMRQARAATPQGANIDWEATRANLERLATFQPRPLSEMLDEPREEPFEVEWLPATPVHSAVPDAPA
jgi:hypothetical protein